MRNSTDDAGWVSWLIARYDGPSAAPVPVREQPLLQEEQVRVSAWIPRIAVQAAPGNPGGATVFVAYDTYAGDPEVANYRTSYVQRIVNSVPEPPIETSSKVTNSVPLRRGDEVIAANESRHAFLAGRGIDPAAVRVTLFVDELLADQQLAFRKSAIENFDQPGRLVEGAESLELNGHWVGALTALLGQRFLARPWSQASTQAGSRGMPGPAGRRVRGGALDGEVLGRGALGDLSKNGRKCRRPRFKPASDGP